MQYICSVENIKNFRQILLSIKKTFLLSVISLTSFANLATAPSSLAAAEPSLEPISLPMSSPTILPTDVAPIAGPQERNALSDDFQITLLNRLPSRFYFNASCESSFRLETNPFQMPSKNSLTYKATGGLPLYMLSVAQRVALNRQLSQVNKTQQIFRVLPNLTAGWYLTTSTRFYTNYFLIRDSALKTSVLNTTVQSISFGLQQDIPMPRPFSLLVDFQGRELYQSHETAVFDYIPSTTLSYSHSARTVAFVSALLQLRGRQPFVAPNREIDPFYSFGLIHRHGMWSFSAYATFVQNFRQLFGGNALIPVNNYSWIADFEIARTISRKLPAQIFLRAEPVFNFHSNATPGISGNDFRLYYGLRMQLSKPPLFAARKAIEQELKQMDKLKTFDQADAPADSPAAATPPVGQNDAPTDGTNSSTIPASTN